MNYKVYIDIFSALLTPTIALVTTYIAIQQYRNNRAKLRHELYDRRVAVYNAVGNFLITRINSIEGGGDAFLKFLIAKHESAGSVSQTLPALFCERLGTSYRVRGLIGRCLRLLRLRASADLSLAFCPRDMKKACFFASLIISSDITLRLKRRNADSIDSP